MCVSANTKVDAEKFWTFLLLKEDDDVHIPLWVSLYYYNFHRCAITVTKFNVADVNRVCMREICIFGKVWATVWFERASHRRTSISHYTTEWIARKTNIITGCTFAKHINGRKFIDQLRSLAVLHNTWLKCARANIRSNLIENKILPLYSLYILPICVIDKNSYRLNSRNVSIVFDAELHALPHVKFSLKRGRNVLVNYFRDITYSAGIIII